MGAGDRQGGLDAAGNAAFLKEYIKPLAAGGISVATYKFGELNVSNGASTITLTPKVEGVDPKTGSKYLDVFAMNHTPLEKLLLGEKLDLNTMGAAWGARRAVAASTRTAPARRR